MRNEEKLIILLSRLNLNEGQINEVIWLLDGKLDWGYITLTCSFNKISNIFYYNLSNIQFKHYVKHQILKLFSANYNFTTMRLRKLREEFEKIVNVLNQNNVNYSVIKGFALSDKVYSEAGSNLRDFNDIDFLVSKDNLTLVNKLLTKMGYLQGDFNRFSNTIVSTTREEVIKMKITSHQLYEYGKMIPIDYEAGILTPSEVDINFTIFEGGNIIPLIATEEILQHVDIIQSRGGPYKCLDNYYMFIQLTYHLFKESNYELMKSELTDLTILKFCDIREYIIRYFPLMDYKILADLVQEYKLNNAIYFTIYFTNYIYNDLNLNDFLEMIKPQNQEFLKDIEVYKSIFTSKLFKRDFIYQCKKTC